MRCIIASVCVQLLLVACSEDRCAAVSIDATVEGAPTGEHAPGTVGVRASGLDCRGLWLCQRDCRDDRECAAICTEDAGEHARYVLAMWSRCDDTSCDAEAGACLAIGDGACAAHAACIADCEEGLDRCEASCRSEAAPACVTCLEAADAACFAEACADEAAAADRCDGACEQTERALSQCRRRRCATRHHHLCDATPPIRGALQARFECPVIDLAVGAIRRAGTVEGTWSLGGTESALDQTCYAWFDSHPDSGEALFALLHQQIDSNRAVAIELQLPKSLYAAGTQTLAEGAEPRPALRVLRIDGGAQRPAAEAEALTLTIEQAGSEIGALFAGTLDAEIAEVP